jgi:hypothetical protein
MPINYANTNMLTGVEFNNWQSTYTNVQTSSASWNNTYSTVQTNSATWSSGTPSNDANTIIGLSMFI